MSSSRLSINGRTIIAGDIMKHFKWETLSDEEKAQDKYKYIIKCFATHTETGEVMVVYQAMYGDWDIYVRPADMFMSEVDHDKYPGIKQKYRFESAMKIPSVWS